MCLFTIESLKYAGSLLYSKSKQYCAESDIVSHAKDTEKDFQVLPILPDAIACQFMTSEKLGEYLILDLPCFQLLFVCYLKLAYIYVLQWLSMEIIVSIYGIFMM